MRRLILASVLSALAAVAGVAAYRLSLDALALIVGLILGMAVMIPALVLAAWGVRPRANPEREHAHGMGPYQAPIVIVPQPQHWQQQTPTSYLNGPEQPALIPPRPALDRQWTLRVFGEDTDATAAPVDDQVWQ